MLGLVELLKYTAPDYPANVIAVFDNIQQFPPNILLTSVSPVIAPDVKDVSALSVRLQTNIASPYLIENVLEPILQSIIIVLIGLLLELFYTKFSTREKLANQSTLKKILIAALRFIVWNNVYILLLGYYIQEMLCLWI